MTDVRLTSHNLPGRVGRAAAAETIRALAAGCDVLVLQEARPHAEHLAALRGWATFTGQTPALTISWRKAMFRRVAFGAVWAHPKTYLGEWGAGKATTPACWDPYVTLEVRGTGQRLTVQDVHFVPSANAQRPAGRDARLSWERRRRCFTAEAEMVAQTAQAAQVFGAYVVAGDFNAEPRFELLDPLRAVGLRTVRTGPTHGTKQIDLAWALGCSLTHLRTVPTPSDHHAVTWAVGLGG